MRKNVLVAMVLFLVLVVGCSSSDTALDIDPNNDDSLIGGQRDDHGCLGPAGYSWHKTVGACIREWELSSDLKKAATIAVDEVGEEYGLTVYEIDVFECDGCFFIHMSKSNGDRVEVLLSEWEVDETPLPGEEDELPFVDEPIDEPVEDDALNGTIDYNIDNSVNNVEVTDFKSCIDAGNPAMESYPRQCRHGDQTFIEKSKNTSLFKVKL